jgi:hypothetical protein
VSQKRCLNKVALLLAVPLVFCSNAFASSNELFSTSDVTAKYDVIGWAQTTFENIKLKRFYAQLNAELALIEPAAGGGSEPIAHGKSQGAKSHTGKALTAAPELPTVTIGGKAVVTYDKSIENDLNAALPDSFKHSSDKELLERRFNIRPYAHSPALGNMHAPIKVFQFTDLSCGQCMPELAKIDAALQEISSSVYIRHIHAPMERFQDTNMPAFYGKIADRGGVFWEYRYNLIKENPSSADAMFELLVKSGVPISEARSMMMTDARRFYRQLDADALLARTFGAGKPPVLFVNGIRVGSGGIPLERLPEVLKYITVRIERGLPEPPNRLEDTP